MVVGIRVYGKGMTAEAQLTAAEDAFLDQIVAQWSTPDRPDRAKAAAWCIEELRRQWQAEGDQDGPDDHLPSDVVN